MNRSNALSIDECKKIQLSILEHIDLVCKTNNIKYFLCGGSLLGAIRHKGYIPWDDDIDIMLLRNDYNRLVELLEKDDRYKYFSHINTNDYNYPFAKVLDTQTYIIEKHADHKIEGLGINVDLFPIDGLPNNEKDRREHYRKILKIRNYYYFSLSDSCPSSSNVFKKNIKKIVWLYARKRGWKYWLNKLIVLAEKFEVSTSEYVGCLVAGYGERETYHKSIYDEQLIVPFEEYKFAIPQGYDEYLSCLYGNYMELPPEDKRVTRHDFVAYKKEKR